MDFGKRPQLFFYQNDLDDHLSAWWWSCSHGGDAAPTPPSAVTGAPPGALEWLVPVLVLIKCEV